MSQAGGSEASIFSSSVAPETMRSARAMKSAKNFSSSGNQAERGHGHSSRPDDRRTAPGVCHRFRYTDVTNVSRGRRTAIHLELTGTTPTGDAPASRSSMRDIRNTFSRRTSHGVVPARATWLALAARCRSARCRRPRSRPSRASSAACSTRARRALPGVTVTVTSKDTGAVRTDVTERRRHLHHHQPRARAPTPSRPSSPASSRRPRRRPRRRPGRTSRDADAGRRRADRDGDRHGRRAGARHRRRPRSASTSRRKKSRTCRSTAATSPT